MSEEKTEAPTAKKKKESRKEGQVPRTQELGSWSTLLAFGMLLDVAAGINEQDFEPKPSFENCSWCDFRLICPASEA